MNSKDLARRILMLTMPWPLSRLFPSSIRIGLSLWPGDLKEVYAGPQGAAYIPGVGATRETVFMPLSAPAAPIFSDVVSWPSDTTAIQSLPSTIPSPPPEGSSDIDVLDETYWLDAENDGSYTVNGVTGNFEAPESFNLYPTNIIDEESEIEGITLDFETSETIGTVNIIQQNVDEPEATRILVDTCSSDLNWEYADGNDFVGQSFFTVDNKSRLSSISFRLSLAAGNISSNQYRAEVWTVEDNAGSHDLVSLLRSSNTVTGDNDWSRTWVPFAFADPVVLLNGVNYALVLHRLTDYSVNKTNICAQAVNTIAGWEEIFKTDGTEKQENAAWEVNIDLSFVNVSGEVTLETFSDVTSGQVLSFSVTSMKNMFIQIVDPSNVAEGIIVTGMSAQTYNFSTG